VNITIDFPHFVKKNAGHGCPIDIITINMYLPLYNDVSLLFVRIRVDLNKKQSIVLQTIELRA